jgi:hypothetical protein
MFHNVKSLTRIADWRSSGARRGRLVPALLLPGQLIRMAGCEFDVGLWADGIAPIPLKHRTHRPG